MADTACPGKSVTVTAGVAANTVTFAKRRAFVRITNLHASQVAWVSFAAYGQTIPEVTVEGADAYPVTAGQTREFTALETAGGVEIVHVIASGAGTKVCVEGPR
jgi:hypothetical protein